MKCPICYSGIPDESDFCPICGAALTKKEEPVAKAPEIPVQPVQPSESVKQTFAEQVPQQVQPQPQPQQPIYQQPLKQQAEQAQQQQYYAQPNNGFYPQQEPNSVDKFPKQELDKCKVISILMYFIPIVFLVPLCSKEYKIPYCKKHSNQCFMLWIANILLSVLSRVVAAVNVDWLSIVWAIFVIVAYGIIFVLWIMGIVQAAKGTKKDLPILGKIHIFDK